MHSLVFATCDKSLSNLDLEDDLQQQIEQYRKTSNAEDLGQKANHFSRYSAMLSFLARHPPRTNIAHLEKFTLDAGLSTVEFRPPGHRFLVSNRLPPQPNPNPHQTDDAAPPAARSPAAVAGPGSSSLAPPPHRHPWQDETFRVVSGTARFITVARGGKGISSWIGGRQEVRERLVSADGEAIVVIPRGQVHTFRNASDETDLVVEFVLDPSSRNTDEAYFREHPHTVFSQPQSTPPLLAVFSSDPASTQNRHSPE